MIRSSFFFGLSQRFTFVLEGITGVTVVVMGKAGRGR
jgi:hypothetical protein